MRKTLLATVLTVAFAPAAMAQMDHSKMDHSAMPMAAEMVHAEATLNAIGEDTINVSHGPIAEIGWPAMTMNMPMMEGVKVPEGIAPGDKIIIMLGQGADGIYAIGGVSASE
ncbi:Cu(I)/Ag(I) efflux system protein CusF [Rhodobacter aestuarii]|uniref:Cu(I)/Ag(I) efflux system protein CusF n=1 Tax=Rhodobacter aestuarii TaxID=453582 RepID=A0A1N7QI40_9RHOB|nr:copper-binding protein [Rhodobacter aestuarii]PTV93309.1 Cu(I)/Ag(I) efflux system protein CusF [Rhodobacter aestuarii]SIT22449.1 Cu(I)/Ag(I) efflux system protein CusF [Rhodobacter aestuarii]